MPTTNLIVKIFVLLFVSSTYSANNLTTKRNYFALITKVHEYYGTSCVFIVHSRQETDEEIYKIQILLRQFSAQKILSVSVEFKQLQDAMDFYSKRAIRSLIVVSLRTRETVNNFSNLTSHFKMQASCWLLLFDDNLYKKSNFAKPGENNFHITFDTEMLVVRNDHSNIQEWFWLQNRVKMEDLAFWDFDTKFILKTNQSLYVRRTNLENSTLVVTTLHNPPMTSFKNKTMGGFFGKIFTELSRVANCNVEFVKPREMSYGSWDKEKKSWTGMIQMLVDGEVNIAAADFSISLSRLESVDFSLPLISTRQKLYIRKPDIGIRWSSYWQTLAPENWIIIQFIILFTTILLTAITAIRRYKITPDVFTGYFLLVLGIYCQQGLPEFPIDLPSRITYLSLFLSAMMVSAAYGAALTSFSTVTALLLPFSTLEEFVDDGTYKLIVLRDGAEYDMFTNATEPTLVQMYLMMDDRASLPRTLLEGLGQVCRKKVAFYVPSALEESIRFLVPCDVVSIETKQSVSLAMALSKKNSYHGIINYHVQRFRDYGILNRLKLEYAVGMNSPISTHTDVTLLGILPILVVLGGGILLASFILFLEKIFYTKLQSRVSASVTKRKKDRVKLESNRSEEVLKIHLRDREKYFTPSSNFVL